jgi:polygalacturonase
VSTSWRWFGWLGLGGREVVKNVAQMGVTGDGVTLNTVAIQKAIDACSAQGGGTLEFPAGRYLTGTIQLKDGVKLRLGKDAVLLGSANAAHYRNLDPFIDGTGSKMGYALVVAVDARRVGIEGEGTIDGQGAALKAAQPKYVIRPFLVRWVRCRDVAVRDVSLVHSGAWTMHFFQCKNIVAERVKINSRGLRNNDGIDIDSCQGALIKDCDILSHDDSICLKATSPLPCRDVTISGCSVQTNCNGIKLGTESIGDFEHVRATDVKMNHVRMCGVALYTVDGGRMHDVVLKNFTMNDVNVPIGMRLGARMKTFRTGDQPNKQPGVLRDVVIKNVVATNAGQIGILANGVPGHPIEDVTIENVRLDLPGGGGAEDARVQLPEKEAEYPEFNMFGKKMPAYGIYARHLRGATFKNVKFSVTKPDGRPEKVFIDVEGTRPASFAP